MKSGVNPGKYSNIGDPFTKFHLTKRGSSQNGSLHKIPFSSQNIKNVRSLFYQQAFHILLVFNIHIIFKNPINNCAIEIECIYFSWKKAVLQSYHNLLNLLNTVSKEKKCLNLFFFLWNLFFFLWSFHILKKMFDVVR